MSGGKSTFSNIALVPLPPRQMGPDCGLQDINLLFMSGDSSGGKFIAGSMNTLALSVLEETKI